MRRAILEELQSEGLLASELRQGPHEDGGQLERRYYWRA